MIRTVNPERTNTPPHGLSLYFTGVSNGADNVVISDAYAAAVAGLPSFPDFSGGASISAITAEGKKITDVAPAHAFVSRGKFKWRFYTATCYLKIWWEKVTIDNDLAVEISRVPQDWTWTPSDSPVCLPADWDASDESTWYVTDEFELFDTEPPDPVPGDGADYVTKMEKFRYSLLPGYTPPDDGSANGFPA